MRRLRSIIPFKTWLRMVPLSMLACGFGLNLATAQPANDNWADAQELLGVWGSLTNDNSGSTAEPGEPSHGGFPATNSIWYKWTAPFDGEVSLDTLGSADVFPLDTVLAVYTGSNVATLRQVAANDDLYPFAQRNASGFFIYPQFLQLGPSSLRFNAVGGTTYY